MATTALDIRRLAYADLPQVIAIGAGRFPRRGRWRCSCSSCPSRAACASRPLRDGRIVGYLICSRYDQVWHVMNVSVDPAQRRIGIASGLITRVVERVGEEARLTLEVRRSNAGAIALYERFGFLAGGVRRRYYQDNGEDALIMWRTPGTLDGRLDDVPSAGPVR